MFNSDKVPPFYWPAVQFTAVLALIGIVVGGFVLALILLRMLVQFVI